MATNLEIEKEQMEKLFDLLMIKKENSGIKVNKLGESINRTKAGMKKENIAWVEKMVEEME